MATKSSLKTSTKSASKLVGKFYCRPSLWLPVLGVLFILCVSAQIAVDKTLYDQNETANTWQIRLLVVEAAKRELGQPATVDIQSARLYLPSARLVLPAQENIPELHYKVDDGVVTLSEAKNVSNAVSAVVGSGLSMGNMSTARQLENVFTEVPSLQACTRQYVLAYTPQSGKELKLQHTKTLSSGKTLYIYQNPACTDVSGRKLLDYVKQVDSY